MGRKAKVYFNGIYAGTLEEAEGKGRKRYLFSYAKDYLADSKAPPISLTLPKREKGYSSDVLFPFFYGLLAEGRLKEIQCRKLRIDENDFFGRLINTAGEDCVGPVTIRKEEEA